MSWYYGTFSCGCEGRVNIIGPLKDREWKSERAFEKMCEDCYEEYLEKEREKKNEEAAQKASEMELPELKGTEKQVAWANTLRQKLIDKFDKSIDESKEDNDLDRVEMLYNALDFMLETEVTASFYIDCRDYSFARIVEKCTEKINKAKKEKELSIPEDIKVETTVAPANQEHKGSVEIVIKDNIIKAYYEKNDTFISVVKDLRYKWNGVWERKIGSLDGTVEDRAAELGNDLLINGFAITIQNKDIREKAISGTYEHECFRWVLLRTTGKYEGKLSINWFDGRNEKLYKIARKLPGSKWDAGSVIVDVSHFEEVEEFAEMYDFEFSKGALKSIETYKRELEAIKVVEPSTNTKEEKDGLEDILNSSTEVISDLLDN